MPRKKSEQPEAAAAKPQKPKTVVEVKLSPVQYNQLEIIARVMNNDTVEEYAKKMLQQHIVDRLYLVQK